MSKKKINSFEPNLLRKGQFQYTFDNDTDKSGSAFFFVCVALPSGSSSAAQCVRSACFVAGDFCQY